MSKAGLIQLAARGIQDTYITGNPQITFFTAVYRRHTNFSMEQIPQFFEGEIDFNKKIWTNIRREGDLIHQMHLEIKLPPLNQDPLANPDYSVSWINSIGHFIIQTIDFEIGGQLIDRHYGQWLEIWSELTLPESKQVGYNFMVGKHNLHTSESEQDGITLFVPLQFWFNRHIGLSLPLIALQYHDVRLGVTFRPFKECWMSSNGNPPGLNGLNSSIQCDSCGDFPIENVVLYVDYIYLDTEERRFFAQKEHEYLVEQLQINTLAINNNTEVPIELNFNHPVKELIWVFQSRNVQNRTTERGNNWIDFSDYLVENNSEDPMTHAQLYFEGTERFCKREAKYFRLMEPYFKHTSIPNNYIYTYSFAYKPEEYQPSGTINFSRIDNAVLHVNLKENMGEMHANIYAVNYNVLKIVGGMGGLLYTT
jgi:hypothetical protein